MTLVLCLCLLAPAKSFPANAENASAGTGSAIELALQGRALAGAGQYGQALAVTQRALAQARDEFGAGHINLAYVLDDLATIHVELGRPEEALQLSDEALAIADRHLSPESTDAAALRANRAVILGALGRYREAQALYEASYAVFATTLGENAERTVRTARSLGNAYLQLDDHDNAQAFLARAIAGGRAVYGETGRTVGLTHLELATARLAADDVDGAIAAAAAARRIFAAQSAPAIADSAAAAVLLAKIDIRRSLLEAADKRLLDAWRELEANGAQQHLVAASVLYNRGFIMVLRGNAVEAEPLYRKVLLIYRNEVGPEHPAVARVRHSLALVYASLGQYAKADEQLALAINSFAGNFGPINAAGAASLVERSLVLTQMRRTVDAIAEAEKALSIYAALEERRDMPHALAHSVLGFAYHEQGELESAERYFLDAVARMGRARGTDSSDLPPALIQLGEIYRKQGRFGDARRVLERAVRIQEKDGAMTGHGLARSLAALARVAESEGRHGEALELARRYVGVMSLRLGVAQQSYSSSALGEQKKSRYLFEEFLGIAGAVAERDQAQRAQLHEEMYAVAQYPHLTDTAAAISQTIARFVPDNPRLAALVRQRQEALQQWRALSALIAQELAAERFAAARVADLRRELGNLGDDIARLDDTLSQQFRAYSELVNPRPVALDELQSLLAPDEALLLQVSGDAGTFLFLVTRQRLYTERTAMSDRELARAVKRVRNGMNIRRGRAGRLPTFDPEPAHYLYENLVAPFAEPLRAVKHIIVVPDRALQNLPPAVLLASPAAGQPRQPGDFRQLDFLGRHFAFSVSPSVSALVALRSNEEPGKRRQPFVGFGDPALSSQPGDDTRGAGYEWVERSVTEIDTRALHKQMAALPETKQELRTMAATLGAGDEVIFLGDEASESRVKRMDLKRYGTIAFATHALTTGEFRGLSEPALVMTPPARASSEDNGLLTASEIARLELDADWVVLSACNTASPDGRPGAEGLSGLAKSFFYAGARALLVSHWWVVSDSTVLLTSGTMRALQAQPDLRRAQALQQAMLQLLDETDYAHPIYWAPFVLVGEGGPMPH